MTYQRLLMRALSSAWAGQTGRRLLQKRVWTIEGGEGARLKLQFPQNPDFLSGCSELPVQRAVAQRLRPGDVFYDVGANMGFFALIAARFVGASGGVCAFEPVAENAAAVRANARLNHLENIRVFELAVGSSSRSEELLLTNWDGGSALVTSVVKPLASTSTRTVRVMALDDLIPAERLRLPTFVKIDVEGVELEVVQGMLKTIGAAKPILLYEIDDGNRESFLRRWVEADEYVSSLGYTIAHLENSYPQLAWNVGHSLATPCGHRSSP